MMHSLDVTKSVIEGLEAHDVLSEVIQVKDFKPWGYISGQFSADAPIAMGNTIKLEKTQSQPQLQFVIDPRLSDEAGAPKITDADLFTLVMTDPDAPSRTDKTYSEYCHYVATDLKLLNETMHSTGGTVTEPQFLATSIDHGNVIETFVPPGPPKNTGLHRYIYILYKQPPHSTGKDFTKVKGRMNWGYGIKGVGAAKWAAENNLTPIAVNFFLTENKE